MCFGSIEIFAWAEAEEEEEEEVAASEKAELT